MIEWTSLGDEEFESLCYDVLAKEGYKNLSWIGKTGHDRGRDITCEKTIPLAESQDLEKTLRCIAQCKKYLAKAPSVSDLRDTITWAEFHKPDMLIIMLTNTLTSDTREWLSGIQKEKKYQILIYEEKNFELFFDRNDDVYTKFFGKERVTPRKSIIMSLLNGDISLEEIVRRTQLTSGEVETSISELHDDRIVSKSENEHVVFRLSTDLKTELSLAHQFLDRKGKFDFLASDYAQTWVKTSLREYVGSRYHLSLSEQEATNVNRLLLISPSALYAALFSPTEMYDTAYSQIERLTPESENRKLSSQSMLASFILMLLECTIADLRDPEPKSTLIRNQVEGYNLTIKLKMANQTAPVLGLDFGMVAILMTASGPIRAGELLTAGPEAFLRNGTILFHLGLPDDALKNLDKALEFMTDKKKLAGAWNNKGSVLLTLGKKPEAKQCFTNALVLDPSIEEARSNLENNP